MSGNHSHDLAGAVGGLRAFRWAVALNAGFVVIETAAGFATGSLALLADAAHNLTDVLGLLVAWGAAALAMRQPSANFTYGFGRATILAALANAIAILIGVGAVVWEAIGRFSDPPEVPGATMLVVALAGIAVNGGTALPFRASRHHDLNADGSYLHMMADAAVSVAVVVAACGILLTGWTWLDPAVAILVSVMIAWAAFGLFRSGLGLSLDAVPAYVNRDEVAAWLQAQPGVEGLHDLHIWSLSTTRTALTAHLVMPGGHPGDGFFDVVADGLARAFSITHVTLQIETGEPGNCRLEPDDVI